MSFVSPKYTSTLFTASFARSYVYVRGSSTVLNWLDKNLLTEDYFHVCLFVFCFRCLFVFCVFCFVFVLVGVLSSVPILNFDQHY